MNPWIAIIAQYGIEFAIELANIIQTKGDPTPEDFQALKAKYGTKTAADYLASAPDPSLPSPATATPKS